MFSGRVPPRLASPPRSAHRTLRGSTRAGMKSPESVGVECLSNSTAPSLRRAYLMREQRTSTACLLYGCRRMQRRSMMANTHDRTRSYHSVTCWLVDDCRLSKSIHNRQCLLYITKYALVLQVWLRVLYSF